MLSLVDWLAIFMGNYTFRTMLLGTTMVGALAGALGCFLYLRKQSLLCDVLGHSALGGVMLAFGLAGWVFGISGRSIIILTVGALLTGLMAAGLCNLISAKTPINQEAAMALTLALFFGLGLVLMRIITRSTLPDRGGISNYLFGNPATFLRADIWVLLAVGGAIAVLLYLWWQPLKAYTFDPVFATCQGFGGRRLNPVILTVTTLALVMGLKAVGLTLIIAFAIMPAAAARQWSKSLGQMVVLAGLIGAACGAGGSILAVSLGRVPTGPVVVLLLAGVVGLSLALAPGRSLLARRWRRQQMRQALGEVGR